MAVLHYHFLHKDRPVRDVPISVIVLLVFSLFLQLFWHSQQKPLVAEAEDLAPPLSARTYVMSSLGEPIAASKFLNLWLQAFDNQPGASISFHQLNYKRITQWLDISLELDPRGHYPMLVAARVYGSIKNNEKKQRIMLDYIFYKFNEEPDKYWRWLAHAVITAKHELKDMELALKYAHALSVKTSDKVPYWAKDMKIIVLEDMGQVEAAKILVGALIDSKEITDPYELKFLTEKIAVLEEKALKKRQTVEK